MKPGTGTNPFYARKHGHVIQNTLDQVLYDLCDDYRPTGARNSLDALETIVKGHPRVELPRPRQSQPEPKQPREYGPQPGSYGATFGFVQQREAAKSVSPLPSPPAPQPPKLSLEDLPKVLGASHGWSEQDSQRQLQLLEHLQASSPQEATSKAYSLSHELSDQVVSKSGWVGLTIVGSLVAGVPGLAAVAADPGLGLALLGGSAAGLLVSHKLHESAGKDYQHSRMASDVGHRIGDQLNGFPHERPQDAGNYTQDCQL